MYNEKYYEQLRDETVALLQFDPHYAELVKKNWPLVLTLFCRHQVEIFHNFLSPSTQAGAALGATLESLEWRVVC